MKFYLFRKARKLNSLCICRAADWGLDKPDWIGRVRVVAKGKELFIKLEDKNSG